MYEEAGQWQDALRICQRHLPHKQTEVNLRYQSAQATMGTGGTKADYLSKGRNLEKSRDFSRAIDAYLLAKKDVLRNPDDLEEVWEQAVRVARSNCKNRYMEVVRLVSERLVEVSKHESAAEILREADQLDDAVSVAISGQAWGKARELAGGNKSLSTRVESAFKGFMVKGGDTSGLMEMGHSSAALDVLAQRGDWNRLWETASKERVSAGTILKYARERRSRGG
jgi:intraflagellar transport protein 172